jgi:hypothetical protein
VYIANKKGKEKKRTKKREGKDGTRPNMLELEVA